MNARLNFIWQRTWKGLGFQCGAVVVSAVVFAGLGSTGAAASFVYETSNEFISSGDFNGDGRVDALVLDKATGNARVGFQDASGALSWAAPTPTGVPHPGSLAVGRFLQTNRSAIAVTSLSWNRIHVLDLSVSSNSPVVINPAHVGSSLLVGLEAPYGTVSPFSFLVAGSQADYDPGVSLLDLLSIAADNSAQFQDQIAAEAQLTSANSLRLGSAATTFVAGMKRGTNDTFAAYSYANQNNTLYRVELHAGTEYVPGSFKWSRDNQTTPGLLFYVPGESNIISQRVIEAGGGFTLGEPTVTSFSSPIQRVFYIDEGTNGFAIIQFGDGVVGARPAGPNDQLQVTYNFGSGSAGNVPTGVIPLGPGKFALLLGISNTVSSAQAQVFTKSGSDYIQTSSSALPATTLNGTRANLWLFAHEPFVSASPTFIASLHAGDWIRSITGLPGSVSVVTESDGGVTNGLGNPTPQSLSSPSLNAAFGLVNQYHPAISLFSYSAPRAAEPVLITISPQPGHYDNPISVTFTKGVSTDHVLYRLGPGGYQEYAAPFALGTNSQVQFYGTTADGSQRSSSQLADYTFTPKPDLLNTNGNSADTNGPAGTGFTNSVPTYAYGTIFYGRRSGTTGSVWAVHLDGSGDHYVTEGVRPRISPEGRYLAFLREGNPFATIPVNNGNIWIRDLLNGTESRLITHNNLIVGFDWEYGNTNLVFDDGCGLFRTGLDGVVTPVAFGTECYDDAPAISPFDGSIAFHNVLGAPATNGIYVAGPGVAAKQRVPVGTLKPRRPSWSRDGQQLAFAHYQYTYIPESGEDLYVVKPDGSDLFQITGFRTVEGFREGALWTPDNDALIGAASIGGLNGIWIVPLTPDRHACGAPPVRLPTIPGDDIDFVGSVFVPPGPPKLFIRQEQNEVILSWRKTAWPDVLQSAPEAAGAVTWAPINPPFLLNNGMLEYHIPAASLQSAAFFRLKRP
jgi:Tol biopolymer transport system component